MDTPIVPQKRCTKCGNDYPATTKYFSRKKKSRDGLNWICKTCGSIQTENWRESNYTVYRKYNTDWKHTHLDAVHRTNQRSYRKQKAINPARFRIRSRNQYHKNIERSRLLQRERRIANPEKARMHKQLRRGRQLNATGTHTDADIQMQFKSQMGRCWWCGCKLNGKYHVDHRIPLSRGGSNAPENLVISCAFCNQSKNDKLPGEWNGRLL